MSSDDSIKVLLACNVTPSDEIDRFEELLQKKCPQFEFKTLDSVAKVKGHKSFEKKMEKLIEHKDTKCVVVVCTPALTAFMDEKSKKNLTEIVADNEKACRSVFKDFFKTEAKEKQKLILVTLGDRCPVPQVLRDFPVIVQNENENAFENLVITQIMSKL